MTAATNAALLLQQWLSRNQLASQYNTYVNTHLRTGDTFYTRALDEKGQDAADQALLEWDRACRRSDFAAGIEPVARGMLALARMDTKSEYAKVVNVVEHMSFPRCYNIYGPAKMVVVFNQQAPGCGCSQPIGAGAFAPYGRLGLKAVTLQAGYSRQGDAVAQLGLVLPQRTLDPENMNKYAYTVVAIELTGYTNGHTYTPGLYKDGYLRYALGLLELDRAVGCAFASGGHFDDAVGFPGATDYLAGSLPQLGEYLTVLAEKLGPNHKH